MYHKFATKNNYKIYKFYRKNLQKCDRGEKQNFRPNENLTPRIL